MKILSTAINQLRANQVKTKSKSVNSRRIAYASWATKPNWANEDTSIQIIKENS